MNAAAVLRSARADGLKLAVSEPGAVKLSGSRAAVDRWMPAIASTKPDIVALLRQEALADRLAPPATAATPSGSQETCPWPEPKITGTPPFGADHLPSRYEAGWKDLLASCPSWATEYQWAETIFSCRDLFAEWGAELLRLGWQQSDIFDRWHGLAWFLKGKAVTALGVRHAFIEDGRVFEKVNA
jgi:hypothetical protein